VITPDHPSRLHPLSFAPASPSGQFDSLAHVGVDNQCRVVIPTRTGPAFGSGSEPEHAGMPPGLRSAADLENRTHLLAGHTGNLNEATSASSERRPSVVTE